MAADEFHARAQLVQLQADKVRDQVEEAARRGDLVAAEAGRREMGLLVQSLRDIHHEQIVHYMPKRQEPRQRWWHLCRPW